MLFRTQQPVVIVDDNADGRLLLSRCLQSFIPNTKAVFLLESGRALLEYLDEMENITAEEFETEVPEMIFLDLLMPGMNGAETLKAVRSQPVWADVPITLVIYSREDLFIRRAGEAGANAFMPKLFSMIDVMKAMSGNDNFSPII